ncbi:dynamin-like protein C-like [Seminavis robusta]|uniref:Dynamin-like protein C-like n=1 Tax=Seminavis robusta TaxID=568900 RepID=A0A9N8H946_9STRA|nr:dynamin-like protein C-like [Seminavis robusta]|eukprot:Sro107_g053890.1 dynamin-like protein C-like (835) ;mRNA; f:63863-66471
MDQVAALSSMSSKSGTRRMSIDERRKLRKQKKKKASRVSEDGSIVVKTNSGGNNPYSEISDERLVQLLSRNEDELLNLVTSITNLYEDKLGKDAPFMTFVLVGMQSTGKSTIVERFMSAVLNIVQQDTGTRCPLDITCIHDDSCKEPRCELRGEELEEHEALDLSIEEVFYLINEHTKALSDNDSFSTKSLRLVYRAKNVQNMRFVDTPGIITNQDVGKNDNRDAIQEILRYEMGKANTKLCLLLEPAEFATNKIVSFCDDTFGAREDWAPKATSIMTKFDMLVGVTPTGSLTNARFAKFHENGLYPFLVSNPFLKIEDLEPAELYKARVDMLGRADEEEANLFGKWTAAHKNFRKEYPTDETLVVDISERISFKEAKKHLRKIMLEDIIARLPEVLAELRYEKTKLEKAHKTLLEKKKFKNPSELKHVAGEILYEIEHKLNSYLDGDLQASINFRDRLQTLDEEIAEEEVSEWSTKDLNHYTEDEDVWRERIAGFEGEYPETVQPDQLFLGGKQVQRAIKFFGQVMIVALPNPFELKELVPNSTGFLGGGLNRENWERAMVQVVQVCVRQTCHPGINYLIKHVGCIFRNLFYMALEDVKHGERLSDTFKLLPTSLEKLFLKEFDAMLWGLMQKAADKTHCSLEPMYETIDPELPTFHALRLGSTPEEGLFKPDGNGGYVEVLSDEESTKSTWIEQAREKLSSMLSLSGDDAKEFLLKESLSRARSKRCFLPEERTSMVTEEETDMILRRAYEYMVALMEFNLVILRFQLNSFLFKGFKKELGKSFKGKLMDEADWKTLVQPDPELEKALVEVEEQIEGVDNSLQQVETLQRRL